MLDFQKMSFEEYVMDNGVANFVAFSGNTAFSKQVNNFIDNLEHLSENDVYNLLNNPNEFVMYDAETNLSYTGIAEFYGSKKDFAIHLIQVELGEKQSNCTINVPSLVVVH